MANQSWVTLLNSGQQPTFGTGLELTNTTTATDVSPGAAVAGQALTIPGELLIPGNLIRVTAAGWYENEAAKKPNITWGLYWGGVTSGKVLLEAAAITSREAAKSQPWRWESLSRIKEIGESGKVQSTGVLYGAQNVAQSATASGPLYLMPNESKTGAEQTINTALATVLTLGVKYSEAGGAAQHLQVMQWAVEILN